MENHQYDVKCHGQRLKISVFEKMYYLRILYKNRKWVDNFWVNYIYLTYFQTSTNYLHHLVIFKLGAQILCGMMKRHVQNIVYISQQYPTIIYQTLSKLGSKQP